MLRPFLRWRAAAPLALLAGLLAVATPLRAADEPAPPGTFSTPGYPDRIPGVGGGPGGVQLPGAAGSRTPSGLERKP